MVLDRAEERIGELKESSVEIIQTEKKKKKVQQQNRAFNNKWIIEAHIQVINMLQIIYNHNQSSYLC